MIKIGDWIIKLSEKSTPKEIMIEVTTRCNFNCIHCFRNVMSDDFRDMDLNLFKRIVDEAALMGVKWIVFSGWGEPLVHKRILELIEYVKKAGMKLLLNTNGFLLEDYVKDVYNLSVDKIVISLDSVKKNLYEKIRIGGVLQNVEKALLEIKALKIRDSTRFPEVNIQFTLNRLNISDLPDLAEFAYKYGVSKVVLSNLIPLHKKQEYELACYSWDECTNLIKKVNKIFIRYGLEHGIEFSLPNFSISSSERDCPFISNNALFIRYDGRVSPCIYYAHDWENSLLNIQREIKSVIFGDLNRKSLIEIWRDQDYTTFRSLVYFMRYPSCLDCVLQPYCTLTLSNEMDCWTNSPSCAHCPYSRDLVRCPL